MFTIMHGTEKGLCPIDWKMIKKTFSTYKEAEQFGKKSYSEDGYAFEIWQKIESFSPLDNTK